MYYYKQTERGEYPLWTVGINDDDGRFDPESDHNSKEEAAKRVRYLNGGEMPAELKEAPGQLTKRERFAMAALQGILANPANSHADVMGVNGGFIAAQMAAQEAVVYADFLLQKLNSQSDATH